MSKKLYCVKDAFDSDFHRCHFFLKKESAVKFLNEMNDQDDLTEWVLFDHHEVHGE